MRPTVRKLMIEGKEEDVLNATAVIEMACSACTPEARAFLAKHHEKEADIARSQPFLSEEAIRGEAVKAAFTALGGRVRDL